MSTNATELFYSMLAAVRSSNRRRKATDPSTPQPAETLEVVGKTFELRCSEHNLCGAKSVDVKWAVANVLHFFAATEAAEPLLRYNRNAARFLAGNNWIGAYGAMAVPRISDCIALLKEHRSTRRAVVHMGPGYESAFSDLNRPCCWSVLHFLENDGALDLLVYQRSLNLFGVMPYDCIVLCNILSFVATAVGVPAGSLRWVVGSLHYPVGSELDGVSRQRLVGVNLPYETLRSALACWEALVSPERWECPYNEYLLHEGEVRT